MTFRGCGHDDRGGASSNRDPHLCEDEVVNHGAQISNELMEEEEGEVCCDEEDLLLQCFQYCMDLMINYASAERNLYKFSPQPKRTLEHQWKGMMRDLITTYCPIHIGLSIH